jgi:hypothetical protein
MACPPPTSKAFSVTLTENNGVWYMDSQGPGQYPTLSVPQCDNANFTFTIQGKSAGVFVDYNQPTSTPVSVAKGSAKPNGNGVDSQITGISVSNNGKTLQFSDGNSTAGDLNYVLHFTDKTTLDPIITNGGGCCTMMPPSTGGGGVSFTSASFVAGLVAGFLIALLLVALVRYGARRA